MIQAIFKTFNKENIQYCLLRDMDQLERFADNGEIDILVRENQLPLLDSLLVMLGFVRLPGWGSAPHHFYLSYDEVSDSWLKLDVVTRVAYGRPTPVYWTTLGEGCLSNRRISGLVFIPAPEDELVTLLLHCLLDKGYFATHRQERIQALRYQVNNEHYITALLVSNWLPEMHWNRLAQRIDAEAWEALLSDRQKVLRRLANRDRLGTVRRKTGNWVLRKLNKWGNPGRLPATTIALLAPDGAGKSTLAENIRHSFYLPVRSIYMGLYQKRAPESDLPGKKNWAPVQRLLRLWVLILIARYHQLHRRIVIFDRFPYDALLPARRHLNWLKKSYRWLLAHTCPAPDLVFLLDAPGEVLFARKGEHDPAFLEEQRQSYLKLRSTIPHMHVIDASREAEFVHRRATKLIWQRYLDLQSERQTGQAARRLASKA